MIKELRIQNFRNLSNLVIELSKGTTIISGQNELGKSNALNALMYLITGTLATDKWGSGENDISSIIPINQVININPKVTIVLDKGQEFAKEYISTWSNDGKKVTGHTTAFYVNGVKQNEAEFKRQLYPLLQYNTKIKSKEVNELRLFTDPLYALQKLDAKPLRALLVELGCSVTDEELYAMGFEDLKPYGEKYLGKWDVLRKQLKDNINLLVNDVKRLMAQIETVSSIEELDDSVLKNLTASLDKLYEEKANLKNSNINPDIAKLETEIANLEGQIKVLYASAEASCQETLAAANREKELICQKMDNQSTEKEKPIKTEIDAISKRINDLEISLKAYDVTINNNNDMCSKYVNIGKDNNSRKASLAIELNEVRTKEFGGMATCPICGTKFPLNEKDLLDFDSNKLAKINSITEEIKKCEELNQKYKEEYQKCKKLVEDAREESSKTSLELLELRNKNASLTERLTAIKNEPVDMSELNNINQKINQLTLAKVGPFKEEEELKEKQLQLDTLKADSRSAIACKLEEIETKINSLNEKITAENVKRSDYAKKLEYEHTLAETQTKLNDAEFLLARVNKLIKTMISLINEKATEKTGLTFVMLEENLSNDGVKEVCYATVDGVPFKDVNTAKKLKYGIKFIEKMKELLGHNDLPILADRMECIDNVDTIKTLTTEQLVCTRVGDEAVITIR